MRYSKTIKPGQRFGRWLVIGYAPPSASGRTRMACRCDCGTERALFTQALTNQETTSCGCGRAENLRRAVMRRRQTGPITCIHGMEAIDVRDPFGNAQTE